MKNNKRNLRVLACLDSFKGSLSSPEAGEAVRAGVTEAVPDAEVIVKTLADGGEGTVRALCREEELRIVKRTTRSDGRSTLFTVLSRMAGTGRL